MLLATFRLEPGAVALEQTVHRLPDVEIKAERVAAHSTRWAMPCLWATHPDFDAVDEALADDPSVDTVVERARFGSETYYQVEWTEDVIRRLDAYLDKEASLLFARLTAAGWRLRIRFVARDQFDVFRETLAEHDDSFQLIELTEPGSPRQSVGSLTPEQRDALVTALEQGYYDVPREGTVQDLADQLGKSHQAVSELLRRGTKKLVDETLTTHDVGSREQS